MIKVNNPFGVFIHLFNVNYIPPTLTISKSDVIKIPFT